MLWPLLQGPVALKLQSPFWDLVPSANPSCTLPEVHWAGWTVFGTWGKAGRCESQSVGPPFCFEYVFQKNHRCQVAPCSVHAQQLTLGCL